MGPALQQEQALLLAPLELLELQRLSLQPRQPMWHLALAALQQEQERQEELLELELVERLALVPLQDHLYCNQLQ